MSAEQTRQKNRNVVLYGIGSVVFMLLFVFFVLRPMYYLICEWTGITGSQFEASETKNLAIDENRAVKVQFLAMNNATMPWQFQPEQSQVTVKPGEVKQVYFYAKNNTTNDMVAQAVPSLSPFEATNYFIKTECFCFNSQPLAAGESVRMGLVFQIDPDLPAWVKTLSLTYTLFDITESADATAASFNRLALYNL